MGRTMPHAQGQNEYGDENVKDQDLCVLKKCSFLLLCVEEAILKKLY